MWIDAVVWTPDVFGQTKEFLAHQKQSDPTTEAVPMTAVETIEAMPSLIGS